MADESSGCSPCHEDTFKQVFQIYLHLSIRENILFMQFLSCNFTGLILSLQKIVQDLRNTASLWIFLSDFHRFIV